MARAASTRTRKPRSDTAFVHEAARILMSIREQEATKAALEIAEFLLDMYRSSPDVTTTKKAAPGAAATKANVTKKKAATKGKGTKPKRKSGATASSRKRTKKDAHAPPCQ